MSNFEKIEGKRKGSINYVHQGFIYTKNNADSIKTRLRCHRWRDGCKGTAFIQENTFHVNINCSHEPEMSEVKKRKVESEIKNAAGSTCTPLRQIYDKLITKDSNIQPFVKLKWAMGKRRKLNLPATPTTAETFKSALKERAGTIAPYFREMSKVADEFFLLFFGDVTSEQMKTVSVIHADATFKVVPKKFYQLLIIHCVFSDILIPVFYALMTSKSRVLYDALFLCIRNFFPSFKPAKCVVDFETALYSSIQFNFESQMQGCLFHYRQALWRKWSRLGIDKDGELIKWLKKLMALPLLPEEKIEQCFYTLAPTEDIKSKSEGDEVVWFYHYIENYWIKRIPLGLLSVYGCARRTNSEVECFHWGLLRKFNIRHPNFWVFVDKLHEIINSYCVEIQQIENGLGTRKRKAKFSKAVDSAIKDAEEKLQNDRINTSEFLVRVAGSTERSFKKMEFQKEFEEEEENNPPDDEDDDNNSDLLCEEDDEEDYDLCSGCDEKPIAHLVQPCGHMLCVNCVKKKKCQLCGSQIFNNVTIDFEDLS